MVFGSDEAKDSNAEAVCMALHSAFIELDDQILKRAVVSHKLSPWQSLLQAGGLYCMGAPFISLDLTFLQCMFLCRALHEIYM